MKYRHYAPDAQVYLPDRATLRYIMDNRKGRSLQQKERKSGFAAMKIPAATLPGSVSLGPRGDDGVQAHRLFECLRSFKEVDVIYGRLPEDSGLACGVEPPSESRRFSDNKTLTSQNKYSGAVN